METNKIKNVDPNETFGAPQGTRLLCLDLPTKTYKFITYINFSIYRNLENEKQKRI